MDEWVYRTVDEIKAKSPAAIAIGPFGSRMKADLYTQAGVRVVRGNNISDTRALHDEFVFISEATAATLRSCEVVGGDLVFPHRGSIGEVGIIPHDAQRYMLSTSLMKLTCDRSTVEPKFAFYFFRSRLGRNELLKNASTVGTPGIGTPLASLRAIRMPVPPLEEQRAIARILGSLDDKIELNRKMNETLEAMARALFKSWFVDFDPVRAKAAGQKPVGMDAATAALFPSKLVKTEHGEVPEGWKIVAAGSVMDVVMGQSPPGDTYNEDGVGVPLINGPTQFADRVTVKNLWTTEERTKRCRVSDLIFCVRGSTTGRRVLADDDYALGRGVCAVRARSVRGQPYVISLVEWLLPELLSKATGSVFPNLSGGDLTGHSISAPPEPVIAAFGALADGLVRRVMHNVTESATLEATRDALLPRLLSGELRVPDAARLVEDAA